MSISSDFLYDYNGYGKSCDFLFAWRWYYILVSLNSALFQNFNNITIIGASIAACTFNS